MRKFDINSFGRITEPRALLEEFEQLSQETAVLRDAVKQLTAVMKDMSKQLVEQASALNTQASRISQLDAELLRVKRLLGFEPTASEPGSS